MYIQMLEEFAWLLAFLCILTCTHYQFRYCIPITLVTLKLVQTCCIMFVLKLYITYRVYGDSIDISHLNRFVQVFLNNTDL
jgi:hypothetical protein